MHEFSINCRRCPRLARHLAQVRKSCPDYYALPVPPFGPIRAKLLIVGLAPGMHGANRTGRPFTGDYAGILLYDTLFRYGFASRPVSTKATDGLKLHGCRITNAVKCLPPENRPMPDEVRRCNDYLAQEIAVLPEGAAILALGVIAHDAVLAAVGLKRSSMPFRHGAQHELRRGTALFDSYHCSRYNTQTRRLTAAMFHEVFDEVRRYFEGSRPLRRRPR